MTFLILFSSFLIQGNAQKAVLPVSRHQFIVIAHRGSHLRNPENSLASCREAIAMGVDYVEIDLRTTLDSQLVLMHNADMQEMTGRPGKVSALTCRELRRNLIRNPDHPGGPFDSIPLFNQVLDVCRGRINLYLDFKNASVEQAWRAIQQAGMTRQVVVYINTEEQYRQWKKVAPEMPLMISLPDAAHQVPAMQKLIDSLQPAILDGSFDEYNKALVKAAFEKGIPIWADIQSPTEGPADWKRALTLGIQGLQTDHPAALIRFLTEQGIR